LNTRNIILFFIFFVCTINSIQAQEYEFRFYIGANYYQGDLSPLNSRFSFSPGRLGLATMLGTKLNNTFRLNVKFMIGQIGGEDADATLDNRKQRNLSFDSPLYEVGINTEISFNSFIKQLDKYGINIYYTTGVNVFKFSPKTSIRLPSGKYELIDLQPLGTEGQGLAGYKDKYRLIQINIPLGIGIKFQLFDNVELGFEFVPRLTFTDYLDDVSDVYISYDDLIAANRPLAAQLANRTGEYLGTGPVNTPTGSLRGNPEDNDWYFFGSTFISYNFGKGFVAKELINTDDLDASEPPEN
jgi:hypothetical protein